MSRSRRQLCMARLLLVSVALCAAVGSTACGLLRQLPTVTVDTVTTNPSDRRTKLLLSSPRLEKKSGDLRVEFDLTNQTSSTLWARVLIDAHPGGDDCTQTKQIEASVTREVVCEQPTYVPERRFDIELTVYGSHGQTKVVERHRRTLRFDNEGEGHLRDY